MKALRTVQAIAIKDCALHAYANLIFHIHVSCLERLKPQWLSPC
jgi:hypothetical protein